MSGDVQFNPPTVSDLPADMYQAHPLPSTWRTRKTLLPDLTPVPLTLALALERLPAPHMLPPQSGHTQFRMPDITSELAPDSTELRKNSVRTRKLMEIPILASVVSSPPDPANGSVLLAVAVLSPRGQKDFVPTLEDVHPQSRRVPGGL